MADETVDQPSSVNGSGLTGVLIFLIVVVVVGLGFFIYRQSSNRLDGGNNAPTQTVIQSTPQVTASPSVVLGVDSMEMEAEPTDQVPSPKESEPTELPTQGIEGDTEAVVFDLTGKNFSYSQNQIKVKEGQTVIINFTSTGGFHDFVIDEFDVATERVNAGEAAPQVVFVASRKGTYAYYCSVGNHRAQGMEGVLIVE